MIESAPGLNIGIGVLVLVYILYRQLTVQPLRELSILPLVLVVVGLVETVGYVANNPTNAGEVLLLILSFCIGMILAVARAFTVKISRQANGGATRQGNVLTAVLWIVGIGQHMFLDTFINSGLGGVSLLLYFGIALLVQRLMLMQRARTLGLFV